MNLDTIVHFVLTVNGYKLNNDLDQWLEYFKEEEDDSIEKAIDEFEEYGFTEEQIRLVRIKFISEFGN